jgi:hypothetical protein
VRQRAVVLQYLNEDHQLGYDARDTARGFSRREVYLSPNRASAEVAIDVFAEKYGAKYDKAVSRSGPFAASIARSGER